MEKIRQPGADRGVEKKIRSCVLSGPPPSEEGEDGGTRTPQRLFLASRSGEVPCGYFVGIFYICALAVTAPTRPHATLHVAMTPVPLVVVPKGA